MTEQKEWSKYQLAIFEKVLFSKTNLIVEAVAGSGKSSTVFEAIRQLRELKPDFKILVLAFNKSVQANARKKLDSQTKCMTFHGLGYSLILQQTPDFEMLDNKKVNNVLTFSKHDSKESQGIITLLRNILKTIRRIGADFKTTGEKRKKKIRNFLEKNKKNLLFQSKIMGDQDEIFQEILTSHIDSILTIIDELDADSTCIDFDDMLRMAVMRDYVTKSSLCPDIIFVDEAQDMNNYQHEMLSQFQKKGVRIISVGDKLQAIYEFRGATRNSMRDIKNITRAEELPLSISYRCSVNIVKYVNSKISKSKMVAQNEGGQVFSVYEDQIVKTIEKHEVSLIISPKNAPLVGLWTTLAQENIASTLKGTNILDSLKFILITAKKKKLSFPNFTQKLEKTVLDLDLCLKYLIKTYSLTTYLEVFQQIQEMDGSFGIHLHTIHSAKGLEAENVLLINQFFPSTQKINMQYVGYTRASKKLIITKPVKQETPYETE